MEPKSKRSNFDKNLQKKTKIKNNRPNELIIKYNNSEPKWSPMVSFLKWKVQSKRRYSENIDFYPVLLLDMQWTLIFERQNWTISQLKANKVKKRKKTALQMMNFLKIWKLFGKTFQKTISSKQACLRWNLWYMK